MTVVVVTNKMVEAGNVMASDLANWSISKALGGLGDSTLYEELSKRDVVNKDLVIAYLDKKIDSVTAMYIAMERARLCQA